MGKSVNGIFANWWGRTGNIVGRIRQGRTILSIYQPNVANPQTAGQMEQRAQFSLLIKALSYMSGAVKVGFKHLDGYKTGTALSAAVGYNFKHNNPFSGTYGTDLELDFSKVQLSQGSVDNPYSPSATADGTTLSLTWADNSGMGNADATDKVVVVAYNDTKKQSVVNTALAERADRNGTMTLPTAWTGDNVDVWLFMCRNNSVCSNSTHLATLPL